MKEEPEARKFTRLLDALLAVPHKAVARKINAEKKKKRAIKRPAVSRASGAA